MTIALDIEKSADDYILRLKRRHIDRLIALIDKVPVRDRLEDRTLLELRKIVVVAKTGSYEGDDQ